MINEPQRYRTFDLESSVFLLPRKLKDRQRECNLPHMHNYLFPNTPMLTPTAIHNGMARPLGRTGLLR